MQTFTKQWGATVKCLTVVTALFLLNTASADIYVDRIIVEFKPGEAARQDVQIKNADEEKPAYVAIEVREVRHPGLDNEERVLVDNPDDISLLATPAKMVIPPGGEKVLRLANLGDGKQERVYRVKVKPVLPPLQETQEGAVVRVVVAYEILVLAYPDEPTEKFEVHRSGRTISVKNLGNSNLFFGDGRQCKAEPDCTTLPSQRVYPGATWTAELPEDAPASYMLTSYKGTRKLEIP